MRGEVSTLRWPGFSGGARRNTVDLSTRNWLLPCRPRDSGGISGHFFFRRDSDSIDWAFEGPKPR